MCLRFPSQDYYIDLRVSNFFLSTFMPVCFSYEKCENKYQDASVRASEGSVVKTLLLGIAGLSPVLGPTAGRSELTPPRVEASPPLALTIFLPLLPHRSLSPRVLGRLVQLCRPQRTAAFTSVLRKSRNRTSPWGGLSFRKIGYSTQHARYCLCQQKTPALLLVHDSSVTTSKCLLSVQWKAGSGLGTVRGWVPDEGESLIRTLAVLIQKRNCDGRRSQ